MSNRVTEKQLLSLVDLANKETGAPREPFTRGDDGRFRANIGNMHLDVNIGGTEVQRMLTEGGGIEVVVQRGTKREVWTALESWLDGWRAAKEDAAARTVSANSAIEE